MDHSKIRSNSHKVSINLATKVKKSTAKSRKKLKTLRTSIKEKGFIPTMKEFISEMWHSGKKPILYLIGLGLLLLILTPILTYLFFVRDLSSKESILTRKNEGVVLQDRNGTPFFTLYEAKTQNPVTLDQINEQTQQAVIAIEDKDFYHHHGFSVSGFGRALIANIRNESITQGGSTLSQQVVKNTLLSQERSFLRKYQELFLAIELERRFSKEDILELYLNTSYFGEGAFGIQDAAQAYFSKDAKDLTLAESALMAGILPAPSAYSPISGNADRAYARQALVLQLMEDQGYITAEERAAAEEQEITFNPSPRSINQTAPHFALMVQEELIEEYGEQQVAQSGYVVKTTLNLQGQQAAQRIVKTQVDRLARNQVTNGAAVVMDPKTGEILALVGSHDWADEDNGKINMATRPRQPGSSFKPIVYAKALEERLITPATVITDEEVTFPGGYTPRNYDRQFRGDVLVRYALANSLNIPAVLVMEKVGLADTIDYAEDLGITTLNAPDRYGLSLVLGAAEVPLTQMTAAFAVFANQGVKAEPTTILEITNKKGDTIYTHEAKTQRVIPSNVAFQISSILADNSARADTFGGSLTIGRQAAVKTGTTDDFRDSLTIGYTPQIVVGAWVGNNDNTEMDNVAGSMGAAPIWREIMTSFLQGMPVVQFTPPNGIIRLEVCRENGLKAEVATESAYPEFFLPGTTPTESCNAPTPTPEDEENEDDEDDNDDDQNNEDRDRDRDRDEDPTPTPTNTPAPTNTPIPTATPDVPLPTSGGTTPPIFETEE